MEARYFDRLSRTVGAAGTRRSAFVGLVAGTAALAGQAGASAARKRKKKDKKDKKDKEQCPTCPECTYCPQRRTCCACRSDPAGPPTTCFFITGLDAADAQAKCIAACGGSDRLWVALVSAADEFSTCTADFTCRTEPCPVPVNA